MNVNKLTLSITLTGYVHLSVLLDANIPKCLIKYMLTWIYTIWYIYLNIMHLPAYYFLVLFFL